MSNAPDEKPAYGTKEYWKSERDRQLDRARFWEAESNKHRKESEYYRTELAKAHALLGRVVHQASEPWVFFWSHQNDSMIYAGAKPIDHFREDIECRMHLRAVIPCDGRADSLRALWKVIEEANDDIQTV